MQSTSLTDSLADEVYALVHTCAPEVDSADTDLLETGILDSAGVVRLLLAVEAHFGVTLPMEELDINSIRTAGSIAELVRQRRAAAAPRRASATDPLLERIHNLFESALFIEAPSPDQDLFQAGILDSMLLVQLIMLLQTEFGVTLSLENLDVTEFSTTAGIAQLIRQSFANPAPPESKIAR